MNEHFTELLQHSDFPESIAWKSSRFRSGETILEEGDLTVNLYILKKGTARVIGSVKLEVEQKIRPGIFELEEGSLFGEISLYDNGPRSASVVATSDCEVISMKREALLEFMEVHPEIGYHLQKVIIVSLVDRLRTANKKLASLFAWGLKAHHIDEAL